MKRKVIQLAANTFVVSLPSAWVEKFGISKGDELEAVVEHGRVTFSTGNDVAVPKSMAVDVSGMGVDSVKSVVSVLHKSGYDALEFVSDDPDLLDVVRARSSQCIGFEVVEQTPMRVVVRNVAGDDARELEQLVRRTFLVTLQLAEGVQGLLSSGKGGVQDVLDLEVANNRLSNYCHRLLNKQSRGPATVYWYLLSWVLESVADEYRDMVLRKEYPDAGGAELVGRVNAHVRRLYEFVYGGDAAAIDDLRRENALLLVECAAAQAAGVRSAGAAHVIVKRGYDCFGSATGVKFLPPRRLFW